MGINKFRDEIESLFEIFGLIENEGFVPFEPGKNYKAFVVKRKPSTFTWGKKGGIIWLLVKRKMPTPAILRLL